MYTWTVKERVKVNVDIAVVPGRNTKYIPKLLQVIPGHIPRKGGQCLAVTYSNIVALNTRLFTRYARRRPSKKINTKKVELTSGSFLIGRRRILVIPRNHLVYAGMRP